jgi:DedD protein
MENKTKHRIFGMLVVATLVLVSLPLFQGAKEASSSSSSLLKAPPFPDQAVQVSTATEEVKAVPIPPSPIPLNDPSKISDNGGINELPDDTIKVSPQEASANKAVPAITQPGEEGNSAKSTETSTTSLPLAQAVKDGVESQMIDKANSFSDATAAPEGTDYIFKNSATTATPAPASVKKTKQVEKFHPRVIKMQQAHNKKPTFDKNSLFKLKSPVWVIQIGSFKNKENAIRLVNKLRMNGYRAFIQQASAYTQVFVGPEGKHNSAKLLKRQLETDMHISGMLVSYKPLTM